MNRDLIFVGEAIACGKSCNASSAPSELKPMCKALLLYDYVLLFADEIRCIWQRKVSVVSLLYALVRYVPLLSQAVRVMQLVLLSPDARL